MLVTEADVTVSSEIIAKAWDFDTLAKPRPLQLHVEQKECVLWSKARNEVLNKRARLERDNEAEETRALKRAELQRLEEERLARAKTEKAREHEEQAKQALQLLQAQRKQAREAREHAKQTFHFDHAF